MHVKKRTVNKDVVQKLSTPLEQKTHKYWRRFMNERAIDRAYVPTNHGIFILC
jgi:hypothetical protein